MTAAELTSWGRYPHFPQTPHPVFWRNEIKVQLQCLRQEYGTTLAYGNGRSYGDSCLAASNHVLHTKGLNRLLKVDWAAGVIVAEAGLLLSDLLELCLPQGWFLPVTPGTGFVTLGGAIANDVHGKNHHVRGTFGCHVKRFSLFRSDHGPLVCSPAENPDLFAATIGGLGLTGIIEWVELQLMPVRSSLVDVTSIRFGSLDEFFALAREFDTSHEYTVAWVDCLAKGSATGRGIFSAANHSPAGPLKNLVAKKKSVPLTPPFSLVNSWSLRVFNHCYYTYTRHPRDQQQTRLPYGPFFYPLDSLLNWNRLYGPSGFQQFQCVLPQATAESGIRSLLNRISKSGHGSFLAVLKQCGTQTSPGVMSFPMPGVSLALDFPQSNTLSKTLLPALDAIVAEAKGRLYPAKDAHMSTDNFRRSYPRWQEVDARRDPSLSSRFWNRVTTE